jgi:hypothetical protein
MFRELGNDLPVGSAAVSSPLGTSVRRRQDNIQLYRRGTALLWLWMRTSGCLLLARF